jgi:hypothetical protein
MTLITNEMLAVVASRFLSIGGRYLLISLMRHLTFGPQYRKKFHALSDPRIARSLVAMHAKPTATPGLWKRWPMRQACRGPRLPIVLRK